MIKPNKTIETPRLATSVLTDQGLARVAGGDNGVIHMDVIGSGDALPLGITGGGK